MKSTYTLNVHCPSNVGVYAALLLHWYISSLLLVSGGGTVLRLIESTACSVSVTTTDCLELALILVVTFSLIPVHHTGSLQCMIRMSNVLYISAVIPDVNSIHVLFIAVWSVWTQLIFSFFCSHYKFCVCQFLHRIFLRIKKTYWLIGNNVVKINSCCILIVKICLY